MTEKEFAALLALEGRSLVVKLMHCRGDFFHDYQLQKYVVAKVLDAEGFVLYHVGPHRRRKYTVDKLIKAYYKHD